MARDLTFAITRYDLVGQRRRLWIQVADRRSGQSTEEEVYLTDAENAAVDADAQAIDAIAATYCVQVGAGFEETLPDATVRLLVEPIAKLPVIDDAAISARLPPKPIKVASADSAEVLP